MNRLNRYPFGFDNFEGIVGHTISMVRLDRLDWLEFLGSIQWMMFYFLRVHDIHLDENATHPRHRWDMGDRRLFFVEAR